MQVTLVAHYGDKPAALSDLVVHLQGRLHDLLGAAFRPYELEQVHGTVIGLEGCRLGHYVKNRNSGVLMNLDGLMAFLRGPRIQPIRVQVGGFQPSAEYPFRSRNAHPYLRSFSCEDDTVVAMGWPHESDSFPSSLDRLRRAFQEFGVRHKWHRTEDEVDNDFFFVLGRLDRRTLDPAVLESSTHMIRLELVSYGETVLEINRDTLQLVGYLDAHLPRDTSCWYRVDEPDLVAILETLYPHCPQERA
jgi:hypothetical protein